MSTTTELSDRQQINISYIAAENQAACCSIKQALQGAADAPTTVHLPFADFSALLTHKLLCQLSVMEADTVVEATTQNVSCFFWPSEKYQQ